MKKDKTFRPDRVLSYFKAEWLPLTEGNCLKDDEADDPGDQVEQALPFVKKLLGRGTPERGRFAFFHPGILLFENSGWVQHGLDTSWSKFRHLFLAKKGASTSWAADAPPMYQTESRGREVIP